MLAEEEAALEEEEEEEEEEDAGRERTARKTRQQQAQAGKTGVGAAAAGAGPFIDTRHERRGKGEREALCRGNLPKEEMERDLSCVTAHDGDAGSGGDVKRLGFKRLAVSAWLLVPRRRLRRW